MWVPSNREQSFIFLLTVYLFIFRSNISFHCTLLCTIIILRHSLELIDIWNRFFGINRKLCMNFIQYEMNEKIFLECFPKRKQKNKKRREKNRKSYHICKMRKNIQICIQLSLSVCVCVTVSFNEYRA